MTAESINLCVRSTNFLALVLGLFAMGVKYQRILTYRESAGLDLWTFVVYVFKLLVLRCVSSLGNKGHVHV